MSIYLSIHLSVHLWIDVYVYESGKICGEGSPCLSTQLRYGEMHFSVGPPYFLHKTDMHAVVDTWTEFVPR